MGMDDWEVQHIHHPAMKKTGVPVFREYFCHGIDRALFKNQSVKHAVNQITKRTGKNQRHADDETPVIFFSDDGLNIKYSEYHSDHSEKGECSFTPVAAELPAPCHA